MAWQGISAIFGKSATFQALTISRRLSGFFLIWLITSVIWSVTLSVRTFPAAPLFAVNRSQFAVLIGPFIPDAYAMFFQVFDIGIAFQEPEQFIDNAFQMQLFWWSPAGTLLRSNRIW